MTTPTRFRCFVPGTPRPQGSSRAFVVGGRAVVTSDNKRLHGWRQTMAQAFAEEARQGGLKVLPCLYPNGQRPLFRCPVCVLAEFVMPRLAAHPKTARGKAVGAHVSKPDLDKLTRALLDALTEGGVLSDDSIVVQTAMYKRYAMLGEKPGVQVEVTEADYSTERG